MQAKNNCRKNMQKKEIINAQKMQMQKRNAKHKEINKHMSCKFKNANAENAFGHPLDSHLGGVRDMQSWLSGFHAFRFLNLPHMQYVQEWVSVRFEWAQRFSGKSWWLAQPPQVPNAAFRESGGPFPRGWSTKGPFVLLFVFFCYCFSLVFVFLCAFYISFLQVSVKKYPALEVPNSDRGPSLSAGHLAGMSLNIARSSPASGFTSDHPFQV